LSSYSHPILSPDFKEKNLEFLNKNGCLQRIFICDSRINAVKEPWFLEDVVEYVKVGAEIKIIDDKTNSLTSLEDYGIYEHKHDSENNVKYVLVAPRDINQSNEGFLQTQLKSKDTEYYEKRFEEVWSNPSYKPIEIINNNYEFRIPSEDDRKTINSVFRNRAILRKWLIPLVPAPRNVVTGRLAWCRTNSEQRCLEVTRGRSSSHLDRISAAVSRRVCLRRLSCEPAVARRVSLSGLQTREGLGVADQGLYVGMRELPSSDFGDSMHDYAPLQAALDRVVLGSLADGDPFERHLGTAAAKAARHPVLQDGLAALCQVTKSHGRSGTLSS
jgi:hypothetical protein